MSDFNPVVGRLRQHLTPDDPAMPESEAASARLRTALEMANAGEMMRLNLRREHPEASSEAISELLKRWLDSRHDDSWGRLAPERLAHL